jgi:3-isopropylmalate dehydrogenase
MTARPSDRASRVRWIESIPGTPPLRAAAVPVVGVLVGEGIGPEVVPAALEVLEAVADVTGRRFDVRLVETPSRAARDAGLPAEVTALGDAVFAAGGAMFCGPVGGRFVYDLRARFDLYCKVVPLRPSPALADAMFVAGDRLAGADVLIVRENVGGLYGGAFGRRDGGRVAFQECAYDARQVDRIVDVAAALAARRSGRLAVVVKRGGIPEVSALWCERADRIADRFGIALDVLDVDNAAFQLVANPRRFDVVVAPNMLGDVLADVGAVLLASRGMSYSVNFGPAGRAVYQTGHGAAYDLAGTDRANPIAQILALAAMLRESFGLFDAAAVVEAAVERVLASGVRTADVAGPGSRVVGTRVLAQHVAMEVAERSSVRAEVS